MRLAWGLPYVAEHEMKYYTFPDLAGIVSQMDVYIAGLKGEAKWIPALSKELKLRKAVTDPGMTLILGNPEEKGSQIVSKILNDMLPGVSYKVIHANYKGPQEFIWTNKVAANEFFRKIGAINIMPDDANYAGDPPAAQLPDGGVLVNAHSRCAAGLMVHEIFHAYGGPAGMFGEGLTDWFTLDFMKTLNTPYAGNPAYAYNVSVVNQLVALAGKERVARMIFLNEDILRGLKAKGDKPTLTGKIIKNAVITGSDVLSWRGRVTELALAAQKETMDNAGLGDKVATMVPRPATAELEVKHGLPGALQALAMVLTALMPK
jgi:hypothetical protein